MAMLPSFLLRRIHAHEHDFTGVVVNGNGTEFQVGDEIIGMNTLGECVVFSDAGAPSL